MVEIAFEDAGVSVLRRPRALAFVWRQGPTAERVSAIERVLEQMKRQSPDGFAVLILVGDGAVIPPQALREQIASIVKRVVGSVKAVAWVLPQRGFQSALARSLFTALFLLIRPSFKPQIFEDLREGARYVFRAVELVDPVALEELVEEMQRKVKA